MSTFQKRHYDVIAQQIDRERHLRSQAPTQIDALIALASLSASIATVLDADNPNFDRVRFLEACGFAPTSKEGSS